MGDNEEKTLQKSYSFDGVSFGAADLHEVDMKYVGAIQKAMTALKARQTIPEKTCDNPVADQFALGKAVGVRGTPAIVLQDGTLIPGYKPADKMAEALGI